MVVRVGDRVLGPVPVGQPSDSVSDATPVEVSLASDPEAGKPNTLLLRTLGVALARQYRSRSSVTEGRRPAL